MTMDAYFNGIQTTAAYSNAVAAGSRTEWTIHWAKEVLNGVFPEDVQHEVATIACFSKEAGEIVSEHIIEQGTKTVLIPDEWKTLYSNDQNDFMLYVRDIATGKTAIGDASYEVLFVNKTTEPLTLRISDSTINGVDCEVERELIAKPGLSVVQVVSYPAGTVAAHGAELKEENLLGLSVEVLSGDTSTYQDTLEFLIR